jgi:DNA polymerase-1
VTSNSFIFDIETDGLLDTVSKIHSLVLSDLDGTVYSCCEKQGYIPLSVGLSKLENADLVIGHNILKYDLPAIQKLYPGFKIKKCRDTLTMSRLLFPDILESDFKAKFKNILFAKKLAGKHALAAWGVRLGEFKGDFGKTSDWAEWSKEMQDYCEQDVLVTLKLYNKLMSLEPSEESLRLEHEFQEIIFQQEHNGIYFDVDAAQKLYYSLKTEAEEVSSVLKNTIPPISKETKLIPKRDNKTRGYKKGVEVIKTTYTPFNPNSHAHILYFLNSKYGFTPTDFTDKGNPQLDRDVLDGLDYEEIPSICKYLDISKILGRLMNQKNEGLLTKHINGKIHGTMITNGAVTGRCTHSVIANIPRVTSYKGLEFRSLFTAGPYKLVGADASQLELRMLAHFLARYDNGAYTTQLLEQDIHTVNQHAAGLPTRDLAKTFIYALIYGAGDAKLGSIVNPSGSQEAQRASGRTLRAKFMSNVPAYKHLIGAVAEAVRGRGYLIGLDGRHLRTRSEHSALNTVLQSAGALVMKQATVMLWQLLRQANIADKCQQVIQYHDEYSLIVSDESICDEVGNIQVEAIQKAGEYFNLKCPLTGEYKIGKNWAETH